MRTTAPAAGGGNGNASGGSRPTVNCPAVAGALGAVPAQAKAEIERNLALLNTQIAEANQRLSPASARAAPNFIQNAILGPLKDKRFATINRMATAIGRNAAKPDLNVQALSTCSLNQAAAASAARTAVAAAAAGAAATATQMAPRRPSTVPR